MASPLLATLLFAYGDISFAVISPSGDINRWLASPNVNIKNKANNYHKKYNYHEVNITNEVSIISRAKRTTIMSETNK